MTDRCHVCFVRIVPSREVVKTATDRTSSERMLGLEGELQTRKDGIKMNYEIVTLEEKTVVGILARTNNTAPDMGEVISGLWNRFFSEGIYESIPDKASEKALGIYTDYEGDEKADYTMMVACETTKRPETGDYAVRTIPAGRYARFIVRGDMVQAVAAAWQEIWKMDLPRAFRYDFEEYQDDAMEDAVIHIYISLT